jgi:hypothetical protein
MRSPTNKAGRIVPERIAVFGGEKSGKTFSHLSIAAMHAKRNSDATFYILDTDLAIERMLMDPTFADLDNIVYEVCTSWAELRDATKLFLGKIQPGDWLVVDMITQAWDMVQRHYIEQVYGMDADDFFLMKQREAKSRGEDTANFGEIIEWPIVNKLYMPWATSIISHRGHLFITAAEKEIGKRERGKAEVKEFLAQGVKIAGQKYTGHLMHTILRIRSATPGHPRFNTVGDRNRAVLKGEEITNFPVGYLVKIAKWKL